MRGASSQSADAACAAVLLTLLKPELAKDLKAKEEKASRRKEEEGAIAEGAPGSQIDGAEPTVPGDDVAVAMARNPFALFVLAHPNVFAAALAAAETISPPPPPQIATSADAADASAASAGTVVATENTEVADASSANSSETDADSAAASVNEKSPSLPPRTEWSMALEALGAARLAQPLWLWASQPAQQALQAAAAAAAAAAASVPANSSGSGGDDKDFVASTKFTGFKAGFAYRAGPKGLGYYKDRKAPLKAPFVPPSAAEAAKLEKMSSSSAAVVAPSPLLLLRDALASNAAAEEALRAVSANPTSGSADAEWPVASRFAAAWAKVRPGV